jgi:hypothetical protein
MNRQCGDCQLCCKLLPVPPLDKKGGERCRYQKHGKGCTVYHRPGFPPECGFWSCRWLVADDTAELSRPDRSHYVIDLMPDFISILNNETGERQNVQVVQVWIDPSYPDAHHDPALRRYLERRAQENTAAIVRKNSKDAVLLFAPAMTGDGQWHEVTSACREKEHSLLEVAAALQGKVEVIGGPR